LSIACGHGHRAVGQSADLFFFYEALTLVDLSAGRAQGRRKAKKGTAIYLGILLATSIGLLLPAIFATYALTGTTDFTAGGILWRSAAGVARVDPAGAVRLRHR
jgi:multicomponent Na+:H+ antiporter subunit D